MATEQSLAETNFFSGLHGESTQDDSTSKLEQIKISGGSSVQTSKFNYQLSPESSNTKNPEEKISKMNFGNKVAPSEDQTLARQQFSNVPNLNESAPLLLTFMEDYEKSTLKTNQILSKLDLKATERFSSGTQV